MELKKGRISLSNVSGNHYFQAGVGGLIGSEVTTAAVFFLTYMAFTSIINLKSKSRGQLAHKLVSALKETCKVSLITIPAGLLSFASADLGIASLSVLLHADAGLAATIGAVGGFVLYSGTAKVAIQNSAENGYLKHD